MSKSALDDFFNKKLGNYNPDVPAHIWENIMAQKEKRRPVAFWLNPKYKNGLFILKFHWAAAIRIASRYSEGTLG